MLNVTDYESHGIGANAITTQYDLTNSFSGVTDIGSGTTYSYSAITLNELATISLAQYNQRISDLLSFAHVSTIAQRNVLLSTAIGDNPECPDFPCQLNYNFTIYKFLTGARIINIGNTYGTAQYTVFTGSITGATWTTIPTFLSLNPTTTYTAAVRDNFDNDIICIVSKDFIVNDLLPNTNPNPPISPSIITKPATAGSGSINNGGGQNIVGFTSVTSYGIEYKIGTIGIPVQAPFTPYNPLIVDNYTQSVTGLLHNTIYQYRAYMVIGTTTYYGAFLQLTTL
jgi:hypothetical protein